MVKYARYSIIGFNPYFRKELPPLTFYDTIGHLNDMKNNEYKYYKHLYLINDTEMQCVLTVNNR